MEDDDEFLKAEGTTVSISPQAEGHGTSLLISFISIFQKKYPFMV